MQKETLYLVPGWLCDRNLFRYQMNALSAVADVRVPDDRDFETLQELAESILEEAPERFAIAGHSLGGRVALEVYRMAPHRVTRIALLNTATTASSENERAARQNILKKALQQGPEVIAREVLLPSLHPGNRTDRTITSLIFDMVNRLSPHYLTRQFNAMVTRPDSTELLKTITCPALVVFAKDDRNLPFDRHGEIASRIPSAKLVIVDECGHMSPLEQPKVIQKALEDWLKVPVAATAAAPAAAAAPAKPVPPSKPQALSI
jgi:pimeloyl-ACP methyl ester carboxylesterase